MLGWDQCYEASATRDELGLAAPERNTSKITTIANGERRVCNRQSATSSASARTSGDDVRSELGDRAGPSAGERRLIGGERGLYRNRPWLLGKCALDSLDHALCGAPRPADHDELGIA